MRQPGNGAFLRILWQLGGNCYTQPRSHVRTGTCAFQAACTIWKTCASRTCALRIGSYACTLRTGTCAFQATCTIRKTCASQTCALRTGSYAFYARTLCACA